jgi:hypothetical protein
MTYFKSQARLFSEGLRIITNLCNHYLNRTYPDVLELSTGQRCRGYVKEMTSPTNCDEVKAK